MNTVAVFSSQAFNHTEPKEYFINPCCFGDDLARWLMEELGQHGHEVHDEPGQEDFGWYFEASFEGERYCFVIGGDGEGLWYVVVERACGLVGSLLGGRHRNVGRPAVAALEQVLSGSDRVQDLRWTSWKEFRGGGALAG